ncbi:hypothetical protein JCM10207_004458 [Rhodosporidiobolus poonsookiae]
MWFTRTSTVDCFYCCSTLHLLAATPSSTKGKQRELDGPVGVGTRKDFRCSVCGQITRRDENGEIVSDEAAFWNSSLNEDSFAKRGSTSRSRLPPSFPTPSTTPFCRTCLANQSLQLHLLASYPSSSSPSSSPRSSPEPELEAEADYPPLAEYKSSLDLRYPLVCAACAPAVEETIKERDYRVKTQALGWRLRESQKRREREERAGERARKREGVRWVVQGVVWRVRGGLWLLTGLGTLAWSCRAITRPSTPLPALIAQHSYLALPIALLSLLYAAWDPTWDKLRWERARRKQVNVGGRETYLALQMLAYFVRLCCAVLVRFDLLTSSTSLRPAAFALGTTSLLALLAPLVPLPYLLHPPPVRLAPSPSSSSLRSFTAPDPLEPLAHLSLSRGASFLARTPEGTPPPGTPTHASSGRKVKGSRLGGMRPRLPSFSLESIPWGKDLAGDVSLPRQRDEAMEVDAAAPAAVAAAAVEVEDADNSMDWTPLPPLSPPVARSTPFSTSTAHVPLARQRFVPPDLRKPTGLEGMFERVGLREEQPAQPQEGAKQRQEKGWLAGLWRA